MAQRKMWLQEEDEVMRQLVEENEKRTQSQKWKWSEIARKLKKKIPESKRSGKQCRERWHNQLSPTIKAEQWSKDQIQKLFYLQNQNGNKWSVIAKQLPGRTDNSVKNLFYSSMRRSIRRLNQYLAEYKKKSNIKPFKSTLLTKILSITDEHYRERLNVKNQKAVEIAQEVKSMLAELSKANEELTEEDKLFREKLISLIQQFNRNCKKRKGKKVQSSHEESEEEMASEKSEELGKSIPRQLKSKGSKRSTKKNKVQMQEDDNDEDDEEKKDKFPDMTLHKNMSRFSEISLHKKSSKKERKDSQYSSGNSQHFDLFNQPQMVTRKSENENHLYELNPLYKKESLQIFDQNPFLSLSRQQSKDHGGFYRFDSKIDEPSLFKQQSKMSSRKSSSL